MADVILGTYENYYNLMATYRKNMGEWHSGMTKDQEDNYWYWREKIKQLRYYAAQENIDLYTLDFDARIAVRNSNIQEEITPLSEKLKEVEEQQKNAKTDQEKAKLLAEAIKLREEITTLYNKMDEDLTDKEKARYKVYINEAYLVQEMVALRQQYDNATPEERVAIAQRAQQIRLKVVALLAGTRDNPYDFERRVWLMYTGEDIQQTQPDLWKTQYNLMKKAVEQYNGMSTTDKGTLVPADKEWEIKNQPDDWNNKWVDRRYETFSGSDMTVFFAFPGYKPIEIGVASLISYSTYREKRQIRTIGAINTKGITKGPRTISGRMVFTVIREHIVEMIKKQLPYLRTLKTIMMDELPPFDVLVSFGNEYGASAGLVIQGITFVDEQKTLTVEDLFTENIFTYLARGLEPMRDILRPSTEDAYNPLEWFTSSFTPAGSEVLGNFKIDELELSKAGALLESPLPFYGAASGWDSALYNVMYDGIDLSDGEILGEVTPPAEDDSGDDTPNDSIENTETGTTFHSDKPFLWAADILNDLKKRNMIAAGYTGHRPKVGSTKKDHRWGYVGETSVALGPTTTKGYEIKDTTYADLATRLDKDSFIEKGGNNGSMEVTLKMYNQVHDQKNKNNLGITRLVDGDVDQTYKVHLTWDYYAPNYGKYNNSSLSVNYTKEGSDKYTEIGVLGFWKKKLTFPYIKYAVEKKATDTTVGYWTKWVAKKYALNELQGIQKTSSKKSLIVGGMSIGPYGLKKLAGKKSTSTGAIIDVPKGGKKIDLKEYLYFPSSIAHISGQRYILDFSDLPKTAIVLCKFVYSLDKPSDPVNGGNKKTFYLKIFRSTVGDGIGNNGYTTNTLKQLAGESAEAWSLYNEEFRKKK